MITTIKQKKIKIEPRIKLNFNVYIKVSICTSRFAYIHQDFYLLIKIMSIQQSFHRYIKIRGDIYSKLDSFRLIVVKLMNKYSRRAGFTIEKGTKSQLEADLVRSYSEANQNQTKNGAITQNKLHGNYSMYLFKNSFILICIHVYTFESNYIYLYSGNCIFLVRVTNETE